jgi:tetratricopeptide (TPR) repeat protein
VGDVNGDGLDDLYVCDGLWLPNRLYTQQPDGTLLDVSASAGVDWLESSHSALMVDLDNDGDQDLAVAILGAVVAAENDGSGHFTVRHVAPVSDDTMSIKLQPDFAQAHARLGDLLAQLEKPQDALRHYEEAFRIDPDLKGIEAKLARVRE